MLVRCPSVSGPQAQAEGDPPNDPLALGNPRIGRARTEESAWGSQSLAQIPFRVMTAHTNQASCCKFCFSDSRFLTCSFDGRVILWDLLGGTTISEFRLQSTPLTECCISYDNQRIFTTSWDKSLKAWDVETGKVLWSVVHTRPLTCCDVSLDGKYIVTGSDIDNAVYVRATESGESIANLQEQHRSTVTSCCFHPDGQRLASTSCDGTARIWDMSVKRTTMTLRKHRNVVSDCCFNQTGSVLCTASWDRSLLVWDITVGNFRSRGPQSLSDGHHGCISSCMISNDATLIVAGSYDQTISIWDTAGLYRKLVLKDSTVRLWDIEKIEQIPVVKAAWREHGERVVKCTHCEKPFSRCRDDSSENLTICVFCRLSASPRSSLRTVPSMPNIPTVPSVLSLPSVSTVPSLPSLSESAPKQ
ncbi:WD repeat-containing protein 88-like isoform X2 [Chiloscyllium plagiosum]|uniref:WD repeat-containing protein 88-like isoform X2 n=1 Tax=Chiloscyllium plagiosum TaxID=36176 RepID=UPI001CB7E725|nr:WD repeat-containing protein 88-like isoform X2 [Chiloscyllium plagiosum]